jgi:glutathione S-transferase
MTHRLWGTPGSLYTAKARSYLIKQGVPFENRAAGEPRFRQEIAPALGRWIIPVLETPDGDLIQDGSVIIEHFEAAGPPRFSVFPQTPRQRLVGQIFELFGGEGLLRPAMHYRWNFDEHNRAFLARDFPAALAPPGAEAEVQAEVFAGASHRMRRAMAGFGVTSETAPAVEAAYAEFLALFEAHLVGSPYLLGGRPCIGDFGLVGPLYAHLGRDPHPAQMMKRDAYRVWRWTERMNAPDPDAGEYGAPRPEYFPDDAIPETLKALLRFVAADYLPEVEAYVAFAEAWLAERPDLEAGTSGLARTQDRSLGLTRFPWRGHELTVSVLPYRLYLLQKIQDAADAAAPTDRAVMEELLAETGLSRLLTLRTARRVERRNNLEVWGPRRG